MPVPPELSDPFVAVPVELVDPGPPAPIAAAPDEVPLLPSPDESVPPRAPDPVVPELPLDSVAREDGSAGALLPDNVPLEEPASTGLSELIAPLVPRVDVAGAL